MKNLSVDEKVFADYKVLLVTVTDVMVALPVLQCSSNKH